MREVILAESAGFCYGVKRAIEMAEQTAAEGVCYTLGALIHNKQETDRLERLGAHLARDIDAIPDGSTVVMRSHGSPLIDYERLAAKGCRIVDATCPNVARIHKIVRQAENEGRLPVIIGDADHPEVLAIRGQCSHSVVLGSEEETREWAQAGEISCDSPITVVHQTTAIRENAKKCDEIIKKEYTNLKIFDTICEATSRRQQEAANWLPNAMR